MKLKKWAVALLISFALLLTAAAGTTLAYLFDRSESVQNAFTPSRVACAVGETDSGYAVTNTGDTTAYLRAVVVVTQTKDGAIGAAAPVYTVTPGSDWLTGADGYYYYAQAVAPGGVTSELKIEGQAADGYNLSVEVFASAIQATTDALEEWSGGAASVGADGKLLVTKSEQP